MENWREHRGGPCPVEPETKLIVRYRSGHVSAPIMARQRRWQAWRPKVGLSAWDITAWRPAPA